MYPETSLLHVKHILTTDVFPRLRSRHICTRPGVDLTVDETTEELERFMWGRRYEGFVFWTLADENAFSRTGVLALTIGGALTRRARLAEGQVLDAEVAYRKVLAHRKYYDSMCRKAKAERDKFCKRVHNLTAEARHLERTTFSHVFAQCAFADTLHVVASIELVHTIGVKRRRARRG